MDTRDLTVDWVATTELHPNPANPRLNDAAVDPVADSLRRFGWQQPIVAKPTGENVTGHTRWQRAAGEEATLESGETFEAVRETRGPDDERAA